jgi:hypothetical protein
MSERACYRYRTPALIGPWRRRPEKALEDAIGAGQARRVGPEGFQWTVSGEVEESLCDYSGPCGGVYPPPD